MGKEAPSCPHSGRLSGSDAGESHHRAPFQHLRVRWDALLGSDKAQVGRTVLHLVSLTKGCGKLTVFCPLQQAATMAEGEGDSLRKSLALVRRCLDLGWASAAALSLL